MQDEDFLTKIQKWEAACVIPGNRLPKENTTTIYKADNKLPHSYGQLQFPSAAEQEAERKSIALVEAKCTRLVDNFFLEQTSASDV